MGTMILCRNPAAVNPYYIEESGLGVYSLEELACYIRQNALLLDESFLRPGLCEWIREELGMPDLAARLREMVSEKAEVSSFVKLILSETGYCTKEEQRRILHEIVSMEKKTEYERRKLKADILCKNGKYTGAIREYRLILSKEYSQKPGALFLGAVWHNLGVAYARLFLFAEAELAFEKAYACSEKNESLRAMLIACLCSRQEGLFKELCIRYYVDEKTMSRLKAEFYREGEHYSGHRYHDRINDLIDDEERSADNIRKEEELLQEMIEDYRQITWL